MFEDEASNYKEMAYTFQKLANDILTLCYETDQTKAELTLTRMIAEYDNNTCMQAATSFSNLDVIAHPCFQSVVTKYWYHNIIPDTSKFKVILLVVKNTQTI
jgi:hypothetical protein